MSRISLNIRPKFNILLVTILLVVAMLFLVFAFSFYRINKINTFSNTLNSLYNEYLQLRKHEHQFLITNIEDPTFFKTGKNVHFRRFETSLTTTHDIIEQINSDELVDRLAVTQNLADLKEAFESYGLIFNQIVNKTYERGSKETGYIGEINRNFNFAYLNVSNNLYRNYLDEVSFSVKNFIIERNLDNYYDFLEKFSVINNFLTDNYGLVSTVNTTDLDSVMYISESSSSVVINQEVVKSLNDFKRNFIALVALDEEIGLTSEDGLKSELNSEISIIETQFEYLNELIAQTYDDVQKKVINYVIIISILLLLALTIFILVLAKSITKPILLLNDYISPLRKGILPEQPLILNTGDEIDQMTRDLNELITGLKDTTNFATKIGEGNFDSNYKPLSDTDELGNSLIQMKKNLQISQHDEEKRKYEDSIRKWANEGLTMFSEIMRQRTKNINELASNVIKNLVNFMQANQGGVFLYNDSKKDDIHLELVASYAYNLERKKKKKIYLGEGLVGTCAIEKAPIYMTDIPNDYITITSGLGGANPTSILIVPLKVEEQILGVIEVASFKKLEPHEIEFAEKLSETIASTLSIAKINQRTAELLEQSQQQAEEMAAQEEEMRQNLEELMATQEEAVRREAEIQSFINAINSAALVFELDLRGKIIHVNNEVVDLFQQQAEVIVGRIYAEYDDSSDNQLENPDFWEKLKNGENIQITQKISVNDEDVWLYEVFTPILDADGFTYKILCIANNITNSKKQEEELAIYAEQMAAQEEEMRQNLEVLQTTQEQLRIQHEELEKSNIKLKSNELILIKSLEKSKEQENNLQLKNRELAERSEELVSQEEELRQNLEELQTTQEEIEKKEGQLKIIVDVLNHTGAILEYDFNGNILYANDKFLELFKCTIDQIKGQHHSIFFDNKNISESENYKNFWEKMKNAEIYESVFYRLDFHGNYITIKGISEPIFSVTGEPIKILELTFDITKEIELEKELRQQEEELRQTMEELYITQEQLAQNNSNLQQNEAKLQELLENSINNEKILKEKTDSLIIKERELKRQLEDINTTFEILESEKKEMDEQLKNVMENEKNVNLKNQEQLNQISELEAQIKILKDNLKNNKK